MENKMINGNFFLDEATFEAMLSCLQPKFKYTEGFFPLSPFMPEPGLVEMYNPDDEIIEAKEWSSLEVCKNFSNADEAEDSYYLFETDFAMWSQGTTIKIVSKGTKSVLEFTLLKDEWYLEFCLHANSCYRVMLDKLRIRSLEKEDDPTFVATESFPVFESHMNMTLEELYEGVE